MPNQVAEEVVGERYTRLHEHQQKISLGVNQGSIGQTHRALVSEVEGRRDQAQARLTGKTEDFRLVHFDATSQARPGDFVDLEITDASAHYLIAKELAHIKTRGGDVHEARTKQGPAATSLGIPTLRKPIASE
jgi:tRNA-2-methylthio-N6-dimethylallyladenosine synthase